MFSVGGDTPPVDPRVGTEPLALLPASGYTPGAPLPGSTRTYTDVAGLLTVNYNLASPVTLDTEVNIPPRLQLASRCYYQHVAEYCDLPYGRPG
jgi:hypothetical protein